MRLDDDTERLKAMTMAMWQAEAGGMYTFDLFANGAIHRSMALISGFQVMVRDFNLVCAGAILRMQLDTALRFHAAYLAPHAFRFAEAVMTGQEVRKLKDRAGQRMTDAYLVQSLAMDYPWVERIYKQGSGYVHLSDTHILSTCYNANRAESTFSMQVSGRDKELPDQVYLDTVATFREITRIFTDHLGGWIQLKEQPTAVQLSLHEPPNGDVRQCRAYLDIGKREAA